MCKTPEAGKLPVVVVIGLHWNRPLELSAMPNLVGKARAQGGMLVEYAHQLPPILAPDHPT